MNNVSNISACASRMQEGLNYRFPRCQGKFDCRDANKYEYRHESARLLIPRSAHRFANDTFPPVPVDCALEHPTFYRKTEYAGGVVGGRAPIQAQSFFLSSRSPAQNRLDVLSAQCQFPGICHKLRCKAFSAFLHPALQHFPSGCGTRTDQKAVCRAPLSLAWLVCY